MAITDPEEIKNIIRGNFDRSVDLYEDFEGKYGLFKDLTLLLADRCGVKKGMTVCDIGCGTGASTFALADVAGSTGSVCGIDFSEEMLRPARERGKEHPNVDFITGDAESIDSCFMEPGADAVLYNACIFLIPNPPSTLRCAHGLLKDGGVVGMTYMKGVHAEPPGEDYPETGVSDLFSAAKEEGLEFAPYGRTLVDVDGLHDVMTELGFKDVKRGIIPVETTAEELRAFYAIPAQSTALYPKTEYEERMVLLDSLLEHVREKGVQKMYQWWGWCAGRKRSKSA